MKKSSFFFVSMLSFLLFLNLTFAARGESTTASPADAHPFLTSHPINQVYALAWSPNGTRLASGGQDRTVHLWNATTGKQMTTYRSVFSTGEVQAVAWSPDGRYLASGSNDGIVQIWDTSMHKLLLAGSNFSGEDEVTSLASGSWDGTVQVWDATTRRTVLTYRGHTEGIWSVSWSPDSRYLVSASKDQTVQVWEAMTGRRLLSYHGHTAEVWNVSWSPDGKDIASVGDGGTVHLWNASTGEEIWRLRLA